MTVVLATQAESAAGCCVKDWVCHVDQRGGGLFPELQTQIRPPSHTVASTYVFHSSSSFQPPQHRKLNPTCSEGEPFIVKGNVQVFKRVNKFVMMVVWCESYEPVLNETCEPWVVLFDYYLLHSFMRLSAVDLWVLVVVVGGGFTFTPEQVNCLQVQ